MSGSYELRVARISELLQRRFAVYPARDASFQMLIEEVDELASFLIAGLDFDSFRPCGSIVSDAERLAEAPVFICGSMKSGTSLLAQLLDDHPDLLVMPGDSHYVNRRQMWRREEFDSIAAHWLQRLINPTGKEPFWFLGRERRLLESFLMYLRHFLRSTRYEVLICVMMSVYAVQASRAGGAPKKLWVEKTPHNELHAAELLARFAGAKFIHVLRDPLNNIVALKKLAAIRREFAPCWLIAENVRALFRAALRNRQVLGAANYHLLAYERLTAQPRQAMGDVARFLDIPFAESMLQPTENGVPGVSNSMFETSRVRGAILDQSRSERYLQHLSGREIRDIVSILYREATALGYDWDRPEIRQYRRGRTAQRLRGIAALGELRLRRTFGLTPERAITPARSREEQRLGDSTAPAREAGGL